MRGNKSGVQERIKQKAVNSFFIHCSAHCLNQALVDTVSFDKIDYMFFEIVNSIKKFFGAPKKNACLEDMLEKDAKIKTLKSSCKTRWSRTADSLVNFHCLYFEVVDALRVIEEEFDDVEIVCQATGFLSRIQSIEFCLRLSAYKNLFSITNIFSKFLQNLNIDFNKVESMFNSTLNFLEKEKNEETFNLYLSETANFLGFESQEELELEFVEI